MQTQTNMIVPFKKYSNCDKHYYCHQCVSVFVKEEKCIFGCEVNWTRATVSAADAKSYLIKDADFVNFVKINP